MPHLIGHHLVQGNTVAKTRSPGMRRRGQKRFVGTVSSIDAGMGESAKHSELLPVRRESIEVRRQRIIPARSSRKEEFGNEAEILVDGDHALRRGLRRSGSEGFEDGQTQAYASGTQQGSTGCLHQLISAGTMDSE